jgi:acetyl-CoA synthetase
VRVDDVTNVLERRMGAAWAPGLPKTRPGKIRRRTLRKIAESDFGSLGDTFTLADPAVVDKLIANRAR